jgi:hypothetical protein
MEANKKAGSKGHIYVVAGKEWIVGEKKSSMWSKAKCNKEKEEEKDKKEDNNKNKDDNKNKK